ncbi:MAG: 3-deoxy-D-manno-octulosonic acid kinase [Pseudomonadota bacterium]
MISRKGSAVILTNPALSEKAAVDEWFDPDYWSGRQQLAGSATGRGAVVFFEHNNERWALRHYQRGGLVARFSRDRYLFTGHRKVRAVREFELLRKLVGIGLPTSAPLAARYQRSGAWYRADLITRFIPHRWTLAQYLIHTLSESDADAGETLNSLGDTLTRVGAVVGRFQAAGVLHADLNCHNVLLADSGVHIIDLDRGTLQSPGSWQQRTLDRLKRSALKVSPERSHDRLLESWPALESAERASRRATPDAPAAVTARSAPGR